MLLKEKVKILFVVDTLAQHGAERYLFEILRAIDKNKFQCTILSTYTLTEKNNYYKTKIEELDIEVNEYNHGDLAPKQTGFLKKLTNSFKYRIVKKIYPSKISKEIELSLKKRLIGYDIISFIKIETFNRFSKIFSEQKNICIHLLSWKSQYFSNPYTELPNRKYHFITMLDSQKEHVVETKFTTIQKQNFEFFNFPLIIDFSDRKNKYSPKNSKKKIAIFSRIDFDQPTLIFLYALHRIIELDPRVELLFFGKNTDKEVFSFYEQQATILGIANNIKFMGHTTDIEQSLIDEKISLCWMNIGNSTLGYSSIELTSYGTPTVFFNIEEKDKSQKDDRLPVYESINEFVNYSYQALNDKEKLQEISEDVNDFVNEKHSANNITKLENFYLSILN